jgi:spermidine synthase
VVAELVPAVAAWNRGPVAALAGRPLEDARVRLQLRDAAACIAEADRAFDAVVLDVDNGAAALSNRANDRLYGDAGLRACHRALRAGGVLAVWSAGPDERFLERLERAGFSPEQRIVAARAGGGMRHAVLLGLKAASRPAVPPPRRPGSRGGQAAPRRRGGQ